MANNSFNLVGLDFTTYKNNLKTYLKSDPQFQDIDFEASNINMLLDLLSYNTYHNAFYLNMIGAEGFMDTAVLRDSLVSHAKELNYVPRSARSSYATVDLLVKPNQFENSITALKGTSFTTKVGSNTYIFTLPETISLTAQESSSNAALNEFYANDVQIFEGFVAVDTFVMDDTNPQQRFVLSNPNIDTTSLSVYVLEDGSVQLTTYLLSSSFFNVGTTDPVFFIQGAENGQYEVMFGNNITGRKPKSGAIITCEYRICNGELPNGASTFRLDGTVGGYSDVTTTIKRSAEYGSNAESVESIRFNAPRFFQTQERAVTAGDYKALLQAEFPEIESIHVYGGEDADPPKYGKVIVAIDVFNADGVSSYDVDRYSKYLKQRTPLTIDPEFVSPTFMYCDISSSVVVDLNSTDVSLEDIKSGVIDTIDQFCQLHINDFDVTLRFSKLTTAIDNTHPSIVGNDTTIKMIKYFAPTDDQLVEKKNISTKVYFYNAINDVVSNEFTYYYQGTTYPKTSIGSVVNADGTGMLHVLINNNMVPIGSVDFENGIVTIDNLAVSSYTGEGIQFTATAANKDITVSRNEILQTRVSDIHVRATGEYI